MGFRGLNKQSSSDRSRSPEAREYVSLRLAGRDAIQLAQKLKARIGLQLQTAQPKSQLYSKPRWTLALNSSDAPLATRPAGHRTRNIVLIPLSLITPSQFAVQHFTSRLPTFLSQTLINSCTFHPLTFEELNTENNNKHRVQWKALRHYGCNQMAGEENVLLCAARPGKGRVEARQSAAKWSGVLGEQNKVQKTDISPEFSVRVLHCDNVWRAPCQASGAASFVSSSQALPHDYSQSILQFNTQSVPRSKHSRSRLYKPVS